MKSDMTVKLILAASGVVFGVTALVVLSTMSKKANKKEEAPPPPPETDDSKVAKSDAFNLKSSLGSTPFFDPL